MTTQYKKLDDLLAQDISGTTVIIRCDLNVPLDKKTHKITDYGRIDASIPTLQKLSDAGAKIIILSHLGRPKEPTDKSLSLAPVAQALDERLTKSVQFAADTVGQDALSRIEGLLPGDSVLLENVRYDPRELSKDDSQREQFVDALLDIVDPGAVFVSDGFGVVHRKQASVYDIARKLPAYAGYLIDKELQVLNHLTAGAEKPYTVVLGGSKVSDKLSVIEALAPKVDSLIIVGGMVFTFLAAQGLEIGKSLVEPDFIDAAKKLLEQYQGTIHLPQDIVAASEFSASADTKTVSNKEIPADYMGLDIGPRSVQDAAEIISKSVTVFWNGPAGVFELAPFAQGTKGIAEAIIRATSQNSAYTVVGGGDSAAAVRTLGLDENGFTHISTGGGASLEFLEGKTLPGLTALN